MKRLEHFNGYWETSDDYGEIEEYAENIEEAMGHLFRAVVMNFYAYGGNRITLRVRNGFIHWDGKKRISMDKIYQFVISYQARKNLKLTAKAWRKQPKTKLLESYFENRKLNRLDLEKLKTS